MKSLLLTPETEADLKLLLALAKKMGVASRTLSDNEKEELGLARAIEAGRKTRLVSRDEVFKVLDERGA